MYAKRLFLPPICSHRVEDFLESIIFPLHESGSLTILKILAQRNYACLLVSTSGATALLRYTPGEVSITSGSKQVLRSLHRLLLRKISELCRHGSSPELLLVFIGENPLPDAESRVAAALTRSGARVAIFSAFFIAFHWFLSSFTRLDLALGMLLSLVVTTLAAVALPPYLMLRALPRWRVPRGQMVRVYKVVLERLDDEVYTAALLAKASISKRRGAYLRPDEVRRVLEEWGVPVREVKLLEYDLYRMLGDGERAVLYITPVPEVTALSLGFARRFSSIVLNAELLVDLEPDELSAVLEHELEHLDRRDTVFLALMLALGLAPLAFANPLAAHASALAAYLAAYAVFLILLSRAVEVRADLAAAARKGAEPLKRAVIKLEYPELLRGMSLRSRVLSILSLSPQPPAWLRIAILEKHAGKRYSLLRALLANVLALKLALEFDRCPITRTCPDSLTQEAGWRSVAALSSTSYSRNT